MSFRGWNTDCVITWGMRCSVMFIRVITSSTEEGMIAFSRTLLCSSLRHVTAQTQEPELIAALELMLVSGLYQHISELSQKRLSKAFIQWSVMPHQRLSKWHLLFEFPEEKKNVFVRYTCIPNRKTRTETVRYEYVYRYTPIIIFFPTQVAYALVCGWHRTAYAACVQRIFSKMALHWSRGDELLNKFVVFVSFVQKNCSRCFIKFRLNHWWQMDYYDDAFLTFLGIDIVIYLAVNGTVTSLPVFIQNILNCVPKTNKAFTGLEQHGGGGG